MSVTAEPVRLDPRNRVTLTVLMVSTFIAFLNETILGVALPSIMSQLNIEASTAQWLSTVYMLTMAIVIPLTGFLLQRFSARTIYAAAMVLFIAGTLIGALAPNFTILLAARVLQAAGTALMMPLLMTSTMVLVPESIRGRIMGIITVVSSLAPALGPPISGLILTVFDWHFIFWLVLPFAVSVMLLGITRVPQDRSAIPARLDVWSVVLSALAFSGIIYGLSGIAESERQAAVISPYVPLGVGALLGVLFVMRQIRLARSDRALLDLRPFRSRTYSLAMILMAIAMITFMGCVILVPIYAQDVMGLDTLTTGLFLLPGGLIMGLMGPIIGRIYDRYGARRLMIPGAILTSITVWFLVALTPQSPPWFILMGNTMLDAGLVLLFTPLYTIVMSSVLPRFYSHSSAIIGTVQQLAGAAGTALFVTVLTIVQVSRLNDGVPDVTAYAAGMRGAFLIGAILTALIVVLAIFVRKPADAAEMAHEIGA